VLASQQDDRHSATVVIAVTPKQATDLAMEQGEYGELWPVLIPVNEWALESPR